jgi:hypothetical protein
MKRAYITAIVHDVILEEVGDLINDILDEEQDRIRVRHARTPSQILREEATQGHTGLPVTSGMFEDDRKEAIGGRVRKLFE